MSCMDLLLVACYCFKITKFAKHCCATLERELGVQLLNRTTRKLSLTEAGSRIFAACQRMAEEYARIGEISQEAGTVPQGVLRMTAPITAGRVFLSR